MLCTEWSVLSVPLRSTNKFGTVRPSIAVFHCFYNWKCPWFQILLLKRRESLRKSHFLAARAALEVILSNEAITRRNHANCLPTYLLFNLPTYLLTYFPSTHLVSQYCCYCKTQKLICAKKQWNTYPPKLCVSHKELVTVYPQPWCDFFSQGGGVNLGGSKLVTHWYINISYFRLETIKEGNTD